MITWVGVPIFVQDWRKLTVFWLLKGNISYKLQAKCKLGRYMSMLWPVSTDGFHCALLSKADMESLEKIQKGLEWITGSKALSYLCQLRLLNPHPSPMFLQVNDIVTCQISQSNSNFRKVKIRVDVLDFSNFPLREMKSKTRIHSENLSIDQ